MGEIALEGMEFFAYHGYYEEERKMGNKYEVNVFVETSFDGAAEEDRLTGTVNYEELYRIVKEEMNIPSKMLEHVGNRIIEHVFATFSQVQNAKVQISKFNPPVRGVCQRARVTLKRVRS